MIHPAFYGGRGLVITENCSIAAAGGSVKQAPAGEFTMYDDDGLSLDYMRNRGTWIRMIWDDDARKLTIEPGAPEEAVNLPGAERTFIVELIPGRETRTVIYRGRRVETIIPIVP